MADFWQVNLKPIGKFSLLLYIFDDIVALISHEATVLQTGIVSLTHPVSILMQPY